MAKRVVRNTSNPKKPMTRSKGSHTVKTSGSRTTSHNLKPNQLPKKTGMRSRTLDIVL